MLAALLAAGGVPAQAAVPLQVDDAWMRAPRPGFNSTVIFMRLKADRDLQVAGARGSFAKAIELHTIRRDGIDVSMVPVPAIELKAGVETRLETRVDAFHLMALGVKRALRDGERVELRLTVRERGGAVDRTLNVPVRVVGSWDPHGEDDPH